MTNRVDATTSTDLNGLAEVMEGVGIAIMGALCGLFVAAMVARADIEEINSLGALLSAACTARSASIWELTFPCCLPAVLSPTPAQARKR
jgi:hypothetical protein